MAKSADAFLDEKDVAPKMSADAFLDEPVHDAAQPSSPSPPVKGPSFWDRLVKPRADTQTPTRIKSGPIGDILKSAGTGAAEGGVYAVPLAGQLIGGVDMGRFLGTAAANKLFGQHDTYPEPIANQIVGALGIKHTPSTTAGSIAEALGMLAAPTGEIAAGTEKAGNLVKKAVRRAVRGGKFEKPAIVNDTTRAADIIAERLKQAEAATGQSAEKAIQRVRDARAKGVPLSLADVAPGTRKLAGTVMRKGGASAAAAIENALNTRDATAPLRLTGALDKMLGKGSVRDTIESLAKKRSEEAGPLFRAAFDKSRTASLEAQYQNAFKDAAERADAASKEINELMDQAAKLRAKTLSGYDSSAAEELRGVEFKLSQKERELTQANADKELTLKHMRGSQTDRAAGAPGVIWTPRIQRLIGNPEVRKGINRGLRIERNMADAHGYTFNPKEYGVVVDADGNATMSELPNMRLLATAKEGLDAELVPTAGSPYYDKITGKLNKDGVALDELRKSLVEELRKANPTYAEALDRWAGESANIRAAHFGKMAARNTPEENALALNKMSESEKEFAKLGLAQDLREKILDTGFSGDEAKRIIKSEWAKQRLRPFFDSDKAFDAFVDAVTNEQAMFETKYAVKGGSQTAERVADDTAGLHTGLQLTRGVVDFARGSYWNVLHTLVNLRRELGLRNNPSLNNAIAKLLFDPEAALDPVEQALPAAEQRLKTVNKTAKGLGAAGAAYGVGHEAAKALGSDNNE